MARRKRRRSLGELRHRKWYKAKSGRDTNWRKLKATIQVARAGDTGESWAGRKPYRAIACVGSASRDFYPRKAANRCGEARGRTPTQAIKKALADLSRSFK